MVKREKPISTEDLKANFAELLRACGYDVIEIKGKDVKKKENSK